MNIRAHELVGRQETSSAELKQRLACTWQVAHGSTGRAWRLGHCAGGLLGDLFGLPTGLPGESTGLLLVLALLSGASALLLLLVVSQDGRLFGQATRLLFLLARPSTRRFGLPMALLLMLTGQRRGRFGLPTHLPLALTRLHGGLLSRSRLGTLRTLVLAVRTLSHTLLLRATALLELIASRHTAHPIQAPGQRLAPHPSCWQALVPTCLFGAHGHDSAHQHTLLSPPWTLQRDEGPPSTPLFAAVTPLLALGFLLLSL